ncbi:unnamed protein product, partial [Medioppia subpectinata]
TINGLIHVLGNRLDYDEWVHKYGAHGWGYADVLPYFRKLENNTDHRLVAQNPGYHGTTGPISIVSDPNPAPLLVRFQKVYNDLGYETLDINGAKQLGTAFTQMTVKDGYRCGTGNGYLSPNKHPSNLKVLTQAFVTRIRFAHKDGEISATGVEFIRRDTKFKVNANIEVILSAGVFNSPQILMLSGVGPKSHLQSHGIPVVKDLPVGNNLQDHPKVVFQTVIKDQDAQPRDPELVIPQLYEFASKRRGPLASYSCLYTFFNTKSNAITQWPNIVLADFVQKMKNNLTEICAKYGERMDEWKQYYRPYLGKYYLRTDANLRKPRSFGTVRLASADPFAKPLIDPNFFDVQQDFNDLVEAAKFTLYLLQESPIAKYIEFNHNPIPGCSLCPDRPMYACDSYVRCYIRLNGEKELHPVGTCRMGAVERPDVVVDPTLKVKGVCRLRVCDASVMPTVMNGNSNTPSIMVGEKCADLIKKDLYSKKVMSSGDDDLKTPLKRLDMNFKKHVFVTDLPALAIPLWKDIPLFDWDYKTVPQKYGLALKEPGVFGERRGKVIGGTSTINGLIHVLGNRLDYDEWVHKYGAHGWGYADVLPYFRKLENNTDHRLVAQNPGYHGTTGPISIVSDPNPAPLLVRFQKVYNDLGYETLDINGAKQLGTAFTQMTVKDGYRCGTGNGYLSPNKHPSNLKVLTQAFVTRIRFAHKDGEISATGVEFIRRDTKFKVNANIEVILSAGVFNSPQILMLSGVGPKSHLQSHGIPVVKDLPVGNNLQDHPKVVFQTVIKDQDAQPRDPELVIPQLYEFASKRRGPLASYSCLYTFFNTKSNAITQWPNIVLADFVQKMKNNLTEICAKYGERMDEWKQYYRPYLGKYYLRTDANLRKPRSFGTVRLASADPFAKPLIDPNFFDVQQDFNDLVEAAKFTLYLLQESPIAKYIEFNHNPIPGCSLCPDRPMYACDSYVRCYIRLNGEKELHPVGTCRMGAVERPDVVVDPTLKVKGVCRLRVCDASVMPTVMNGNSNTPSIMVGEKCADLIKKDLYSKKVMSSGDDDLKTPLKRLVF